MKMRLFCVIRRLNEKMKKLVENVFKASEKSILEVIF